jgi:hypothetical protein
VTNTMSIREFCETVYCAYAAHDALTLGPDARIAFNASVTNGARTIPYRLAFDDVRSFTRQPERPSDPEDRIELTVIEVEREGGAWRVWLDLWGVQAVEFRCSRITLDGREVVGEGRWLQDWLPERGA